MRSTNIRYLPALDHLRAFAAILIVLYHTLQLVRQHLPLGGAPPADGLLQTANPILALVVEGHTSVGFFMVLSGFIFTFGTLDRPISYWEFLRNRFLRIYPLYVVVLVVAIYSVPQEYSFTGLLASLLFQANLPGAFRSADLIGVAWAVAVEFQFYLAFPFLKRFVERYGVRYLFGVLALFWVLRLLATLGTTSMRDISYWTIVGRMDEFIIGMMAGVLYVRRPRLARSLSLMLPISVMAVLGSVFFLHRHGGFVQGSAYVWFFWPTIEAIAWAFFLLTYLSAAKWIPQPLSWTLTKVGELSFSIYIVHFPIITFLCRGHYRFHVVNDFITNSVLFAAVAVLPLVILVSLLTYNVVEKPFLGLRKAYVRATPSPEGSGGPTSP